MFTVQTLSEGKWPLIALGLLILATARFCPSRWALLLPVVLLLFTLAFFRDPDRQGPSDPNAIVAPADGRIVEIKPVAHGTQVAIFLSIFDVHVQRAPIAGTITKVEYHTGRFLDVRHPDASRLNENRVIEMVAPDGLRVAVRQIAGLIARRIVGWAGENARLERGDRLGMIKFGSRVELTLPAGVEVAAKVGDYAKGGETVVARRK